uniref:Uncharacterized protein n=1 Tax=Naja naja TaxID=35670 RepID=A0A8C6XVK4_NAJNA
MNDSTWMSADQQLQASLSPPQEETMRSMQHPPTHLPLTLQAEGRGVPNWPQVAFDFFKNPYFFMDRHTHTHTHTHTQNSCGICWPFFGLKLKPLT